MKKIIAVILMLSIIITNHSIQSKAQDKQRGERLYQTYNGSIYQVKFNVISRWNCHFNGVITIKNKSSKVIDDWNLQFKANFEIENLQQAEVVEHAGKHYFIKNKTWNQDIEPGKEVEFFFTASYDTNNIQEPSEFKMVNYLTDLSQDKYEITYEQESDWGTGFTGAIYIKNVSNEIISDWQLEFQMDQKIEFFWSAEVLTHKENIYHIKNMGFNANINPKQSLRVGIMGVKGKKGDNPSEFQLRHIDCENYSDADTDRDGLSNEFELQIGSDSCLLDTDGDGLDDGYEYSELQTDPTKIDTDNNGVSDDEEDIDGDKLTNIEEYELGTIPTITDTDSDGLCDGREILVYHTDPMIEDTDGDGLLDGEEIKMGLNPLKKDTNSNGILDGDEVFYQTTSLEINEEGASAVTKVDVAFNTAHCIDSVCQIQNIYGVDVVSSEVEGLVGVPIDVNVSTKFEKATLVFHYDKEALNETEEDDLAVLWYDEKNDWYELLDEDSKIDKSRHTVSINTTHFSTYMLVDSKKWFNAWKSNPDYRGKHKYFDIVYAIDTSKSMLTGERLRKAKKATDLFINKQESNDKAALVSFGGTSSIIKPLGTSVLDLKIAMNKLQISSKNGTDIKGGLLKSINELKNGKNMNKMLILTCDGDFDFDKDIAKSAKDSNIKIFAINIGSAKEGDSLKKYANATEGEYFYCPTVDKIETVYAEIEKKTLNKIDKTDSDRDGLYDVYENQGMRLKNGKLIKTNPNKKDTDGDGMTDFEESGIKYNKVKRKIGKMGFIFVTYFELYSNPTKKDTDKDKLIDSEDPYPWHAYCGGKNADWAEKHSYELNDSGYYVCSRCKKKIKSPELEDKNVLSEKDYNIIKSLSAMHAYYSVARIEQNKSDKLSMNEKLLNNKIVRIRSKKEYRFRYSYHDKEGICPQKIYPVYGSLNVTFTEIDRIKQLGYNGFWEQLAGVTITYRAPELIPLWTITAAAYDWDESKKFGQADIPVETILAGGLSYIINKTEKGIEKSMLTMLNNTLTGLLILDSFENNKVEIGDYEVKVFINRGKTPRYSYELRQSKAGFVLDKNNSVFRYIHLGEEWGTDCLESN